MLPSPKGGTVLADDGRARPAAQGHVPLVLASGRADGACPHRQAAGRRRNVADRGHPDLQRFSAKRMAATTHAVDSSHAPVLSHPDLVIDVIRAAFIAVQGVSTAA